MWAAGPGLSRLDVHVAAGVPPEVNLKATPVRESTRSPTTICGRVWLTGAVEPAAWLLSATTQFEKSEEEGRRMAEWPSW